MEHAVIRKLRREILPDIIAAQNLRKAWFYRAHTVYAYGHDLLAIVAGFGMSSPLLALFNGKPVSRSTTSASVFDPATNQGIPDWLLVGAIAAALLWALLKAAVVRENAEKRAVLAKSCMREFKAFRHRLHRALLEPNPMPALNSLGQDMQRLIDRNIQDGVWMVDDLSITHSDGVSIDNMIEAIRNRHEHNWADVPQIDVLNKENSNE